MILTAGAAYPAPSDDTVELLYQVRQANANVTLDANRTYHIRAVRFAAGVTLTIPATTVIELADDLTFASRSLMIENVAGVTIQGEGTIRGTTSVRTAVYGLIRAQLADNLTIAGVTLHTSPSQAIWVYGGDGLAIADVNVHTTGADGIQVTRGATNFEILRPDISDTGDDAIGVISYVSTGPIQHDPCANFLIDGPTIANVGTGRGIAVSGGVNGVVRNFDINGADQAGVLVAGGSTAHRSANMTVEDGLIRDVGRDIPASGTGDGCYVTQSDIVTLSRLDIDQCAAGTRYGILAIDSTSTSIDVGAGHTFGPTMLASISHG